MVLRGDDETGSRVLPELRIIPPSSRYLRFELESTTDKTAVWRVVSISSEATLGRIAWYGPWRQYTFFPGSATAWNTGCLGDVVSFIESAMRARRTSP